MPRIGRFRKKKREQDVGWEGGTGFEMLKTVVDGRAEMGCAASATMQECYQQSRQ